MNIEPINYDVLDHLDVIDDITLEYEIKVANSLLNSYIKAYQLMENGVYNNHMFFTEYFDVIQEASGNPDKSKESAGEKILNLISSILNAIINSIKKLFSDSDLDSENLKKEAELAAKRRKARPASLNKIEDAINKANEESDELDEDDTRRKARIIKYLASLGIGTATTIATWYMKMRSNEFGFVTLKDNQVVFLFKREKVLKYYKTRLNEIKDFVQDLETEFKKDDESSIDLSLDFDDSIPEYYPFDIYEDDKETVSQNAVDNFTKEMDKINKELLTELEKANNIVKKFKKEHKKLKVEKLHKTDDYVAYANLASDYKKFKTGLHNLYSKNGKNMDGFLKNVFEKGMLAVGSAAALGGASGLIREFNAEDIQTWVNIFFKDKK